MTGALKICTDKYLTTGFGKKRVIRFLEYQLAGNSIVNPELALENYMHRFEK